MDHDIEQAADDQYAEYVTEQAADQAAGDPVPAEAVEATAKLLSGFDNCILGDAIADQGITPEDADVVREFWDFLATLPMSVLRRHQHTLGLSDEQLAAAKQNRSGTVYDDDPPGGSR